jgi:hypothetical protein
MASPIVKNLYRPLKDDESMMEVQLDRLNNCARVALAGVRLFNGVAALFFPRFLARMLGVNPDLNPAILYVFRLFGVRTIIIGAELLSPVATTRAESLRTATVIHASDALAAAWAGIQKQLPLHAAVTTTAISTGNTILAILAQPCRADRRS